MLRDRAALEKLSIGELVRKAVKKTYENKDEARLKKIQAAHKWILTHRKVQKNIDYKALINAGRKY